jgi:hypothetical protein
MSTGSGSENAKSGGKMVAWFDTTLLLRGKNRNVIYLLKRMPVQKWIAAWEPKERFHVM